MSRGHVHLVVGPVGAGKSTYARALCERHGALGLYLDEWMARLFRPDRPDGDIIEWYSERATRCVEQIWHVARGLTELGHPVVLEVGLIRREQRAVFYQALELAGAAHTVYLVDAPRDVRRARVSRRNVDRGETFVMEVSPELFELASDMWQAPDEGELAARHFVVV